MMSTRTAKPQSLKVRYEAEHRPCFEVQTLESRMLLSVSVDAAGWTQVGASPDTRVIYVSQSAGKDSNNGLSANTPVKTLSHAKKLMRSGKPDWMLLKRGDVWQESLGNWNLSGRSGQEPILISSYGSGNRPVLKTGADAAITSSSSDTVSHVAIIGLHLYAHTRDPGGSFVSSRGNAGVKWMSGGSNLLIENTVVQSYQDNLLIQSAKGFKDFKLRRSQVVDAYAVGRHSQGMFVKNVTGIVLEENLFDHNGWNEKVKGANATIFNHNIYIQADSAGLVARNNIISRASSHGLQARPGGIVTGNTFVQNPLGLSFGYVLGGAVKKGLVSNRGVGGQIADNVFLNGNDIDGRLLRGTGMEVANLNNVRITGNLIANDASNSPGSRAMYIDGAMAGGMRNVQIENNTIYNWLGGVRVIGSAGDFNNVSFSKNTVQNFDNTRAVVDSQTSLPANQFKLSNNTYYSPRSGVFRIGGKEMGLGEWIGKSGDTNSRTTLLKMADPHRDVAAYHGALGRTRSLAGFLSAARHVNGVQPQYTAQAVNRYVRAGYGLSSGGKTKIASPSPRPHQRAAKNKSISDTERPTIAIGNPNKAITTPGDANDRRRR